MSQNVLVVHGGGPTAVINASLYGVIEEAKRNPEVGKVYGAIGGTGAIFSETFIDLTSFDDEKLKASFAYTCFGNWLFKISFV